MWHDGLLTHGLDDDSGKHNPPVRAYRTPFASRLTRNAPAITTKRPATVVTLGY